MKRRGFIKTLLGLVAVAIAPITKANAVPIKSGIKFIEPVGFDWKTDQWERITWPIKHQTRMVCTEFENFTFSDDGSALVKDSSKPSKLLMEPIPLVARRILARYPMGFGERAVQGDVALAKLVYGGDEITGSSMEFNDKCVDYLRRIGYEPCYLVSHTGRPEFYGFTGHGETLYSHRAPGK